MKQRRIQIILMTMLFVIIYVLGIGAGYLTAHYMTVEWPKSDLLYYAKQRSIEYVDSDRVRNWSNGCMAVIIYDDDGNFEDFNRLNGDPFSINFVDQSEPYVDQVLKGKTVVELYPVVKNYSKLGYTSFIYVGIPLEKDGEIIGAFFWIKESEDFLKILIAFFIIFTLFYIIFIFLWIINFLRQIRFEKMQRKYIDNITHELKTPVASIKALTEALSDGMVKTESEKNVYYGMILKEINKQQRMIRDTLELSKLQTRQENHESLKVSCRELLEPVEEKYGPMCELMDIEFKIDSEVYSLPYLYTVPKLIIQVFKILMDNAIKFVPEGGHITIFGKKENSNVIFCVKDDGCGISKNDLPHVFERFYMANRDDGNESGSGIGLAIAKETMDLLKGSIWVESEPGSGTSFYFTVKCIGGTPAHID